MSIFGSLIKSHLPSSGQTQSGCFWMVDMEVQISFPIPLPLLALALALISLANFSPA